VFAGIQLLGELLLQLLAEALAEFGLEAIREAIRPSKPGRPLVAAIGYVLLGALFAFVSLWPFPHSFVQHAWLRLANLVIAPSIAGLAAVALGRWRISRGQTGLYLHRFSYGFLFALTFALTRFAFSR
jgi:hypothetical protein